MTPQPITPEFIGPRFPDFYAECACLDGARDRAAGSLDSMASYTSSLRGLRWYMAGRMNTHYLTYIDYPDLDLGAGDPCSFDQACDEYAAARENGLHATVMRIDPPSETQCGFVYDVTPDADECIRRRYRQRAAYDLPEWLEAV